MLHLAIGDVIKSFPSTNTYSNTKPIRKDTFSPASYFSFPYHIYSRRDKIFMTNRIYANEISKIFDCNFKYILSKYFLSTNILRCSYIYIYSISPLVHLQPLPFYDICSVMLSWQTAHANLIRLSIQNRVWIIYESFLSSLRISLWMAKLRSLLPN